MELQLKHLTIHKRNSVVGKGPPHSIPDMIMDSCCWPGRGTCPNVTYGSHFLLNCSSLCTKFGLPVASARWVHACGPGMWHTDEVPDHHASSSQLQTKSYHTKGPITSCLLSSAAEASHTLSRSAMDVPNCRLWGLVVSSCRDEKILPGAERAPWKSAVHPPTSSCTLNIAMNAF